MKNSHHFTKLLLISAAAIVLAVPAAQAYITYTVGTLTLGPGVIFNFEVEGTSRGVDHAAFNVTGSAHFDGTLQISPVNGYIPADGDSFLFFDWLTAGATATGNFHTFDLPALDPASTGTPNNFLQTEPSS